MTNEDLCQREKALHWQAKQAMDIDVTNRSTNSPLTCWGLSMSHFLSWSSLSCIGFSPWILASRESSSFRTAPSCSRENNMVKNILEILIKYFADLVPGDAEAGQQCGGGEQLRRPLRHPPHLGGRGDGALGGEGHAFTMD